ncbi:hypothetical protein PROFUN_10402 [Planoprotostelium fungivorum]|uniref:Chitinase n=1 Tax=Planoprotostelium fungivorum TaxID=1890364 RepID=A0A2P6NDZ7_9EUKA|nr:hypothetical protein PROFUN_10402 [Planoprotostelium fungivorum]
MSPILRTEKALSKNLSIDCGHPSQAFLGFRHRNTIKGGNSSMDRARTITRTRGMTSSTRSFKVSHNMRWSTVFLVFCFFQFTVAENTTLSGCALDPQGCTGSTDGPCCSMYGYCGSTDAYCGANCYSGCPSTTSTVSSTTTTSATSANVTTTLTGCAIDPTGCANYPDGPCCSIYGYCGHTDAYCGEYCYSGCTSTAPTTANVTTTLTGCTVDPNGCSGSTEGSCCSLYGYCGNTTAHCGENCYSGCPSTTITSSITSSPSVTTTTSSTVATTSQTSSTTTSSHTSASTSSSTQSTISMALTSSSTKSTISTTSTSLQSSTSNVTTTLSGCAIDPNGCSGSTEGPCCSIYGFTTLHCGEYCYSGCQQTTTTLTGCMIDGCPDPTMPCCSTHGYCGNTTAHCVDGCYSGCTKTITTTTSAVSNNRTITTFTPPSTQELSCIQTGCADSSSGPCCSTYGYCGRGDQYCLGSACANGDCVADPNVPDFETTLGPNVNHRVVLGYYVSEIAQLSSACRVPPEYVDTTLYTHISISYADIDSNYNVLATANDQLAWYSQIQILRKRNPGLKLLISIGSSASNSDSYYNALSANNNSKSFDLFATNAVNFARKWNFDGIDIFWSSHLKAPTNDHRIFIALRSAIQADATIHVSVHTQCTYLTGYQNNTLVLITTTEGSQTPSQGRWMSPSVPYVDLFSVSGFAYAGGLFSSYTDGSCAWNATYANIGCQRDNLETYLSLGVPTNKTLMSFYNFGLSFSVDLTNVAASHKYLLNNPTTQNPLPISGTCGASVGSLYHIDVMQLANTNGWMAMWDYYTSTPYLVSTDGTQVVSYEDKRLADIKMNYAILNNYAGGAIWNLDRSTVLSDYVSKRLLSNETKESLRASLPPSPGSIILGPPSAVIGRTSMILTTSSWTTFSPPLQYTYSYLPDGATTSVIWSTTNSTTPPCVVVVSSQTNGASAINVQFTVTATDARGHSASISTSQMLTVDSTITANSQAQAISKCSDMQDTTSTTGYLQGLLTIQQSTSSTTEKTQLINQMATVLLNTSTQSMGNTEATLRTAVMAQLCQDNTCPLSKLVTSFTNMMSSNSDKTYSGDFALQAVNTLSAMLSVSGTAQKKRTDNQWVTPIRYIVEKVMDNLLYNRTCDSSFVSASTSSLGIYTSCTTLQTSPSVLVAANGTINIPSTVLQTGGVSPICHLSLTSSVRYNVRAIYWGPTTPVAEGNASSPVISVTMTPGEHSNLPSNITLLMGSITGSGLYCASRQNYTLPFVKDDTCHLSVSNGLVYCSCNHMTDYTIYKSATPTSAAPTSSSSTFPGWAIAIIVVAVVAVIGVAVLLLVVRKQRMKKDIFGMRRQIPLFDINSKFKLSSDEFSDLREIGSGAFGVVFSAKWREMHVAIKQLKNMNADEKEMREFVAEVELLQQLRPHPNVILLIGLLVHPDPTSIVTEFCQNGSLYSYLRKIDCELEVKMHFIVGIARGMLHLHKENIIHRDLAVRNILLTETMIPKVSDFGLSRTANADPESASQTQTTVGPIKWMAPEAIVNREYSRKSDVFSFGVVIWEILTVQDPFPDLGPVEAAMQVVREGVRLTPPSDTPEDLSVIMNLSWKTDPQERPTFAQILHKLIPDLSSTNTPDVSPPSTGQEAPALYSDVSEYNPSDVIYAPVSHHPNMVHPFTDSVV